jgi:hypothetical protein
MERSRLPHGFNSGLVERGVSGALKDFHLAQVPILVDHGLDYDFPFGSIYPC